MNQAKKKLCIYPNSTVVLWTAPGACMACFINTKEVNEHQIWLIVHHIVCHVKLTSRKHSGYTER